MALWPVAMVYGWLLRLRTWCYQAGWLRITRIPVPVVVVGNVVAGGAGKTPVVMALATHLRARGHQVGIISRGHGRRTTDCREVLAGASATECGDEPLLIKRALSLPVFVARDRAQAALALLQAYPSTRIIVSDDGLQHLGLARDVEICLFDQRGIGNGFLLPAGPLREPWPRPVDLVLSSADPPTAGHHRVSRKLVGHAIRADGTSVPLEQFRGKPLIAVAAIAHPQDFFQMLRARGLELKAAIGLPDHHDFSGWTVEGDSAAQLLFTEKDATKLWARYPEGWAVPLAVTLEPAFLLGFDRLIDARLSLPSETSTETEHG